MERHFSGVIVTGTLWAMPAAALGALVGATVGYAAGTAVDLFFFPEEPAPSSPSIEAEDEGPFAEIE